MTRSSQDRPSSGGGRGLNLSAILTKKPPVAIINDQVLEIGDSVKGFKIIHIDAQTVTLDNNRERIYLPLEETVVKEPVRP